MKIIHCDGTYIGLQNRNGDWKQGAHCKKKDGKEPAMQESGLGGGAWRVLETVRKQVWIKIGVLGMEQQKLKLRFR